MLMIRYHISIILLVIFISVHFLSQHHYLFISDPADRLKVKNAVLETLPEHVRESLSKKRARPKKASRKIELPLSDIPPEFHLGITVPLISAEEKKKEKEDIFQNMINSAITKAKTNKANRELSSKVMASIDALVSEISCSLGQ